MGEMTPFVSQNSLCGAQFPEWQLVIALRGMKVASIGMQVARFAMELPLKWEDASLPLWA